MGYTFLEKELKEVVRQIEHHKLLNKDVSSGSVGWHLDHVLLVVKSIYGQMESSDSKLYKSKFNLIRTLVFATNNIPRGKGKSPDRVRPKNDISKAEILEHLKLVQELVDKFDTLPKRSYFDHPYFGMLHREQAKKFIRIHTTHHLKIIRDILK